MPLSYKLFIIGEASFLSLTIKVPRYYLEFNSPVLTTKLHGFIDASKLAFVAVVHMQSMYEDRSVKVCLVFGSLKNLFSSNKEADHTMFRVAGFCNFELANE